MKYAEIVDELNSIHESKMTFHALIDQNPTDAMNIADLMWFGLYPLLGNVARAIKERTGLLVMMSWGGSDMYIRIAMPNGKDVLVYDGSDYEIIAKYMGWDNE